MAALRAFESSQEELRNAITDGSIFKEELVSSSIPEFPDLISEDSAHPCQATIISDTADSVATETGSATGQDDLCSLLQQMNPETRAFAQYMAQRMRASDS